MRRFLTRRIPPFTRVLLVESGSRNLLERIIPYIYSVSASAEIDVVTCYSGAPAGLREGSNVFRTADYPDGAPRAALVKHLNSRDAAGIDMTEFFDFKNAPLATPPVNPPGVTFGQCYDGLP